MTLEDLKEMLDKIIPTASFGTSKGEIIIRTGLMEENDCGELIECDEVDEDFDFSEDHSLDEELDDF